MASRPQREPGGHGLTDTPRVMKKTPKRTFTACRRCHSRKAKCSGNRPCLTCSTAGLQDECSYITKDRIVRVNESYLQRILEECENAKQAFAAAIAATNSQSTVPCDSHVLPETDSEIHISNPLVEDKAWFVPISTVDNPVYIGDSACSSFATGIRRALDTSCSRAAHPPRHHYLSDGSLVLCSTDSLPWPTKVKASLLVRVALTYVGRLHHVVLPSVTIQRLDEVYEDLTVVTTLDAGKYLALFALGEAFSMKSYVEGRNEVPGLQYFIVASRMAQNIPERATVELVETILLLSFYSHILNRRHSAYNFIGTALRLSMTLGLHHSIPAHINVNTVIRQHRLRLWWTIYCCERVWASQLGYAISVQDSSIGAEMPSFSGLDEKQMLDFADPDYSIATIKLARIVGDVMMTVYNRNQKQPFIRSVREISRNLKQWKINLPGSIRLPPGDPSTDLPKHLLYLNLFFNQCMILVTRPVLLYVLKQRVSFDSSISGTPAISPLIYSLVEDSIQAARQTSELVTHSWISGTLCTLGCFGSHFIFSSAMILVISSILTPEGSDKILFDTTSQILHNFADHGNLTAAEFHSHLELIRKSMKPHYEKTPENQNYMGHVEMGSVLPEAAGNVATETILVGIITRNFLLDSEALNGDFDFLDQLVGFEDGQFYSAGS